mgnify:CR=1 FL=1
MTEKSVTEQLVPLVERIRELERRASESGRKISPIAQLGEIIRKERHAQKLNQRDLHELCGVAKATISAIEQGQLSVRMDSIRRVTEALGLDLYVGAKP